MEGDKRQKEVLTIKKLNYEKKSIICNGIGGNLPFAGFKEGTTVSGYHGYYWSSSLYAEYPDDSGSAWLFYNEGNEYDMSFDFRNLGLTIRPVHPAE